MTDRSRQQRAGRRVLVVDDDERARTVVCWQLEADGFTVAQAWARSASEAASRVTSEFLPAVSHELRTPLQAITGSTEPLGTLDLNPERRRDALRHIAGAASHILALADDVLDIAKIEARALPLQITDVELTGLVGKVLDLLAPLAAQRGVTLDRSALDGAVRADRRRLRQILINLVTNGIRYHHGAGWVRVEATPAPGTEERIVRVADNGRGIPSALLGRLFMPIDRLGRDDPRPGEPEPARGTGLGLVLARGLTEALQGCLEVQSVAEVGTTVAVALPDVSTVTAAAREDPV
ncbi:ATP-binding protein [Pseudonocardia acidicola]|uniref:histidine kinase n=1 Tax=Pseudonocardia acidicola TaxID=2724939 RepID=A0ABX1S9D0_9PSEU|nr:hypothetical protein [Pseudonocardia acidicola]